MADHPKDQSDNAKSAVEPAVEKDKLQSPGRRENAAEPLDAAPDEGGAERYPSVRQDDAVERTGRAKEVTGERSGFEPRHDLLGPSGDPAEGKR